MLGPIWMQIVWQSDGILERKFWNFEEKKSADDKKAWKIAQHAMR